MDALTEPEIEVIVQRLETLVTDLEHATGWGWTRHRAG